VPFALLAASVLRVQLLNQLIWGARNTILAFRSHPLKPEYHECLCPETLETVGARQIACDVVFGLCDGVNEDSSSQLVSRPKAHCLTWSL